MEHGINTHVKIMAIDDQFVEQGMVEDLRKKIGIDYNSIYTEIRELV